MEEITQLLVHGYLDEWLRNFTYKPGYDFAIRRWDGEYYIVLDAPAEDSNGVKVNARLTGHQRIPPDIYNLMETHDCEEAFYDLLKIFVDQIESHEANEWFRIKGVKIYDPHSPYSRGYVVLNRPVTDITIHQKAKK